MFDSVNDPPLFDLNGEDPGRDYSTSFTEEGPPVFLSSRDMTLIDVDNTSLESVTVRITNLLDGDMEVLTLSGDFYYKFPTASMDYNSGILTVSGLGEVSNSTIQEDDSSPLDNQTETQTLCNSTVVSATCSPGGGSEPNTTAVSYTTAPMHHLVHHRSTPSWDLIERMLLMVQLCTIQLPIQRSMSRTHPLFASPTRMLFLLRTMMTPWYISVSQLLAF